MNDALQPLRTFHADSFRRAYERCMYPTEQGLGIPALICAALAAELGLKEILRQKGIPFGKKHELIDLLDLLPTDDRAWIRSEVQKEYPDMDQHLAKANRAFVDWRYFYESPGPIEVNIEFVGNLATAVVSRMQASGPAL